MPLPKNKKLAGFAIREDQRDELKRAARERGKTQSEIVRDMLDRYLLPPPDVTAERK